MSPDALENVVIFLRFSENSKTMVMHLYDSIPYRACVMLSSIRCMTSSYSKTSVFVRLHENEKHAFSSISTLRYLNACFSCCNETFLLLLRFLPNLRLSQVSSLPSFFTIVSFSKVVVFASFSRFLLPSFQTIADKILVTFTNFGTVYNSY